MTVAEQALCTWCGKPGSPKWPLSNGLHWGCGDNRERQMCSGCGRKTVAHAFDSRTGEIQSVCRNDADYTGNCVRPTVGTKICQSCQGHFLAIWQDGVPLCQACYEKSGVRHSYSTRVDHVFAARTTQVGSRMVMGVEIEALVRQGASMGRAIQELSEQVGDWAILKSDGSLDYGLELATVPMSLKAHREKWQAMRWPGYLTTDQGSVGMHVHVNRGALSSPAIGRLCAFMYAGANARNITRLAGRGNDRYAALPPYDDAISYGDVAHLTNTLRRQLGKYCGLNLLPSKTIEFRVFQSVLDAKTITRNLEFVHALCKFAHTEQPRLSDYTWDRFAEHTAQQPRFYPLLQAWLKQ